MNENSSHTPDSGWIITSEEAAEVVRLSSTVPDFRSRAAVISIVGIDPGPACGIVTLHYPESGGLIPHAYQCDCASAPSLLEWLLMSQAGTWKAGGIERFVRGPQSVRGRSAADAGITIEIHDRLVHMASRYGVTLASRPAGLVKPWATDARLKEAGLGTSVIPAKMVDARDAARQALYAAVRDAGIPDPFSRKAGKP